MLSRYWLRPVQGAAQERSRGSLLTPPPQPPPQGPGRGQQARAAARPGAPPAEPAHQEEEGGAGGQAAAVPLRAGAAETAAEVEPGGWGPQTTPLLPPRPPAGPGGARPAVTADQEAEPDEDWTQSPRLACVLTRPLPSLCDFGPVASPL